MQTHPLAPRLAPRLGGLRARGLSPVWAVTIATLGLTAAAVGYQLRFASAVPFQDEWDLVPELADYAADGRLWDWVALRHNEHRYIPGRAVYAWLMTVSGYKFGFGMATTVGLLGLTALVFATAVRRLRGRSSWGDVLIPATLLNWGHGFNLLMAYQVVYALFALAAAGLVWVLATDRGRRRSDVVAGLAVLGVAVNGGGLGVALVGPLGLWLLYRMSVRWVDGAVPGWWAVGTAVVPVTLTAAYVTWVVLGVQPYPESIAPPTPWLKAAAAGQFLAMGFGLWVPDYFWQGIGLATAVYAGTTGLLVRAWWLTPSERVRAAGLLAILAGLVVAAAAISWRRGYGLHEHYPTPSGIGLCVAWAVIARYGVGRPTVTLATAGMVLAVALVAANLGPAWRLGTVRKMYARDFQAAVREGLPPGFLAHRFYGVFLPDDRFRERLDGMRRHRIAGMEVTPPDPPVRGVPVVPPPAGLPPCSYPEYVTGPPAVTVEAPGRQVVGLRVEIELDRDPSWLELRLVWEPVGGGKPKVAKVYPAIRQRRQVTTFWVNDVPTAVRLEPGCPTFGVVIRRAEWLIDE